jgi:hypothetical protein
VAPKRKPARKPLDEKIRESLKQKAKNSRFFQAELTEVYRKGQGAYLSSGSRNVPMEAWAMGRVNAYIKGEPKTRAADKKIYARYNKKR